MQQLIHAGSPRLHFLDGYPCAESDPTSNVPGRSPVLVEAPGVAAPHAAVERFETAIGQFGSADQEVGEVHVAVVVDEFGAVGRGVLVGVDVDVGVGVGEAACVGNGVSVG